MYKYQEIGIGKTVYAMYNANVWMKQNNEFLLNEIWLDDKWNCTSYNNNLQWHMKWPAKTQDSSLHRKRDQIMLLWNYVMATAKYY